MSQIPFLLAVGSSLLIAPFVHEGSHWFVGWVGGSDPKTEWVLGIIPNGVTHREIKTMDSELIRFAGMVNFLWIPFLFHAGMLFLIERSPAYLFIASLFFFVTIGMSTESDAIAFREPELFRRKAIKNEFARNPLFLPNWIIPPRFTRF